VLLLVCLAATGTATAQTPAGGTLQGTVSDPTGAVISGAEVEIISAETGSTRTAHTTSAGRYVAPSLPPGLYRVSLSAPGFAPEVYSRVEISVGETLTLDAQLAVGRVTDAITVTEAPPPLEPDRTEMSFLVDATAIRHLPINGRRWEDFVLLTPAVSEDGGNGLVSFRGLSGLYNNNLVDGADNNQAFFAESRGRSRLQYVYSLSSIREFQVVTQNYSAEAGRAAGGVVNAVTRSAGNALHGEAFYFFRDDAFLAQDPLAKARGEPKPPERRQQFGGSVGGALVHDELFLFGTYDQQVRSFPLTVVAQDADFADACTLPECGPAMDFIRGLLGVRPRQGNQSIFLLKPDWVLSPRHRLSAVFNYLNWRSPNGILRDPVVNDAVEAQGRDDVRAEFLTMSLQSNLTPARLNELRFQFGRDFEFQQQNTSGPLLDLRGFRAIRAGMREFLPRAAFPDEHRWQWMDNFTWVRGRHAVKFGADINYVRDTIVQIFQGGGIYRWRTANDFAQDFAGTCPASRNFHCYRDFVQAIDPISGDGRGFFTTTDWNFYVQDSLKLRRNLLLNLGLRYELQAMPKPERPNPAVPETALLNSDTNNLAPRVGLAWQPAVRLVVRAGYGIFYGRTPNSTIFTHLFQNGVSQQAFGFQPSDCAAPLFPNLVFPPPSTAPLGPPAPGLPVPTVQPPPSGCAIDPRGAAVTTLAPDFANPLIHQADLAVEYQLGDDWTVSASYLLSRGNRLPIFVDSNVAPAIGEVSYEIRDASGQLTRTVTLPLYTARRDPSLGVVKTGYSVLNSWYHGLVLEVRKRFSHGLQLDSHLTIAKATDNGVLPAADGTFSGTLVPLDPFNFRGEYSLSDLDVRRRFVFSAYWELPWKHLASPAGKALADGWQISAIAQVRDGNPETPLVTGSPACPGAISGGLTCGSADTFGLPAFTYRAPQLGRNTFYGPRSGRATLDLRVGRAFALDESRRIEVFWEAFNLFNRTHFTEFNTLAFEFTRPGAAGLQTGLSCPAGTGTNGCLFPLADFLEPQLSGTRLLGAREMQLGVRFSF
jgi:hypothetical protein